MTSFATLRRFYLMVTVVDVSIPKVIAPCYDLCFPPPQLTCSFRQSGGGEVNDISSFLCGALLRRMELILQTHRQYAASTTSLAAGYSAECVLAAR